MELWFNDVNQEFMSRAGLVGTAFGRHMLDAIHVSFFKYGTVLTKPPSLLEKFQASELAKFEEEGNHERLVNAANYDMFLYTVKQPDTKYIEHAKKMFAMFDDNLYKGTDSSQSVTRIMKPVSEWLREDILNG